MGMSVKLAVLVIVVVPCQLWSRVCCEEEAASGLKAHRAWNVHIQKLLDTFLCTPSFPPKV